MSTEPAKHTPGPSALMREALDKIGDDWTRYPNGVYDRTLKAMTRRGFIEERYLRHEQGTGGQFQYRRTEAGRAAIKKATGEAA